MTRLLLISLLTLAGCASPQSTAVGPDHPANPNASTGAAPSHATASSPVTAPHDHAAHQHPVANHDKPAQGADAAKPLYMCPMHPDVTSANPEDRCPKCGMKIDKPVPPEPHP